MIHNSCASDKIKGSIEYGIISQLFGVGESKYMTPGARSNLNDYLLRVYDIEINGTVEGSWSMWGLPKCQGC